MKELEKGKKVLRVIDGSFFTVNKVYTALGCKIVDDKGNTTHYNPNNYIDAESNDIEYVLNNLKRNMWLKTKKGTISKISIIDPDSNNYNFKTSGYISNDDIEMIYYYNPNEVKNNPDTITIGKYIYNKSEVEKALKNLKQLN